MRRSANFIDRVTCGSGNGCTCARHYGPAPLARDSRIRFESAWANAGVAPCYPGGHVAFTLKDEQGGIVAVFVNEAFDVRRLEVGPPGDAAAMNTASEHGFARNMPPGTFDVFVSVGWRDGTPVIALPLPGHDGHRRYSLGRIAVD